MLHERHSLPALMRATSILTASAAIWRMGDTENGRRASRAFMLELVAST
jgi:hypothetical protein